MAKQIDAIYQAYTARIIKYLSSTEFYNHFMSVLENGKNTFQFSNRKVEKHIDEAWVSAIEEVIKPIEEIIANPRNFIAQEEAIVNIALAKKVTPDSVRHLAQHGNMIDTVENGNVRPNRLLNKFKEDTLNTYENRFVYTLLEMAWDFVSKRYEAIFAAMGEEYGAFLKMNADMRSYYEHVTTNIDIRIRQEEDLLTTDEKNETVFSRIARLHRLLGSFRQTGFAKEVAKYGKIKPPLVRTNAIAKNPNFKACNKLWNFFTMYEEIGYNITISEQSTKIDEAFTRDIYHSILFNYIILKNYLENPKDREIPVSKNVKKTKIKPKFITEIVEEFVKNYDLPDVVVRKVLIEEITKAQLMLEEEEERQRLVAEKEKEMQEKKRLEEQERQRQAREAEKERIRREKELQAEQERQKREIERREQEENKKAAAFKAELEKFLVIRAGAAELRRKEDQDNARRSAKAKSEAVKPKQTAPEKKVRESKKTEVEQEAKPENQNSSQEAAVKEKALPKQDEAIAVKEKAITNKNTTPKAPKTTKSKSVLTDKEKQALEKAKLAEKEKAAKEKAKLAEKEKLAREKAKAKEKAAKEKAKLAEKEKLAREKAKQAEKEKAAKEKARSANKTQTAEKAKKVKEDREIRAAAVEETLQLIDKPENDLTQNASENTDIRLPKTEKPKLSKITSEEAALAEFLNDVHALKENYIKEAVTGGLISKRELSILNSDKEIDGEALFDSIDAEDSETAAEAVLKPETEEEKSTDDTVAEAREAAPTENKAPASDKPEQAESQPEEAEPREAAYNKADLFKDAIKAIEETAAKEAEKLNNEEKQQKKKGLGKVLSGLFRSQG
jgi:hypothetical protein